MRNQLKSVAETLLLRSGLAALRRARHADRTLILAYHNIVPDGEAVAGDASLHLPQRRFGEQLDVLGRLADVVPLTEVLSDAPRPTRRPRVVLTFDDATQGALTAGVEEVLRRGLPATIFVAPAFVGGRSFWWDAVTAESVGVLTEDLRRHALTALRGRDESVREWAVSGGASLRDVPVHQTCATESQLRAAAARGIAFGSHTWSHPNLGTLTLAELRVELERPLQWLTDTIDTAIPWLAYPYGLVSPDVAAAAHAAGYEGALRVDGGWLPQQLELPSRYMLPRLNVPAGLSAPGFELRISGVLG